MCVQDIGMNQAIENGKKYQVSFINANGEASVRNFTGAQLKIHLQAEKAGIVKNTVFEEIADDAPLGKVA